LCNSCFNSQLLYSTKYSNTLEVQLSQIEKPNFFRSENNISDTTPLDSAGVKYLF